MLRRVLLLIFLLPVVAFAQPPRLPTDGAIYVGESYRGRTMLAVLYLYSSGPAELRLVEAPARAPVEDGPGEEESVELILTGNYLEHPRVLEVTTHNWAFYADTLPSGALDSRGDAWFSDNKPSSIEFEAIGSLVTGGLRFADGSFTVQRLAPFFYWQPWNQVEFDLSLDEDVAEGLLPLNEDVPVVPVRTYVHSRMVHLTALDRDLVSYFTLIESLTGDARSRSIRLPTTLMREDRGSWEQVTDVCAAAGRLGWACDESGLRLKVIDDLRRQDASLVEEGEVHEHTHWLLDSFVLTPDGVLFLFNYRVGPYSQGSFEVDVPYSELAD